MRAVKFLFSGGLLILLGPIMHILDVVFAPLHLLCWLLGIPLFVAGLVISPNGPKIPILQENLPQKECPACKMTHDFDYPKCPFCGHDYQAKQGK